jgi:hypothetical protein
VDPVGRPDVGYVGGGPAFIFGIGLAFLACDCSGEYAASAARRRSNRLRQWGVYVNMRTLFAVCGNHDPIERQNRKKFPTRLSRNFDHHDKVCWGNDPELVGFDEHPASVTFLLIDLGRAHVWDFRSSSRWLGIRNRPLPVRQKRSPHDARTTRRI